MYNINSNKASRNSKGLDIETSNISNNNSAKSFMKKVMKLTFFHPVCVLDAHHRPSLLDLQFQRL